MKKFLIISLCLIMVAFLFLPFATHAAELQNDGSAIGFWTFNETVDTDSLKAISTEYYGSYDTDFSFIFTKSDGTQVTASKLRLERTGEILYYHDDGTGKLTSAYDLGAWTNESYRTIQILSEPNSAFVDWLMLNATTVEAPKCDGSDCSWADDDYNQVCDTCGLVLFNFRYNLLDYAYDFLNESFLDHEYWVIEQDTIFPDGEVYYNLYKSRSPFKYSNGGLHSDSDYLKALVKLDTDGVPTSVWWVTVEGSTVSLADSPVNTSHDIDGFFPLSLPQRVEIVVQEGILEMIQQTSRTMMVLMITGISLIALLVVLNLFGKRSLIYRKQ